jgi:hypothetical protein
VIKLDITLDMLTGDDAVGVFVQCISFGIFTEGRDLAEILVSV